jgi:anti-anti-sigma factor
LEQAFDGGSLYGLRAAVAAHATAAGLPPGRVEDLVIAAHELAANSVQHGAGHGRLRMWVHGGVLHCEIADEGRPAAAGAGPETDHTAGDASLWRIEDGHGLRLIRQIADQASMQTGPDGTAAVISFFLGPPGKLPPSGLTQRSEHGCVILAVTGQLGQDSSSELTSAVDDLIATAPELRLILDLARVTTCDSSGLAALLIAQRHITASRGAQMILAGVPGHLQQRLTDGGLASKFTLASTTGDAIDMLIPRH